MWPHGVAAESATRVQSHKPVSVMSIILGEYLTKIYYVALPIKLVVVYSSSLTLTITTSTQIS